MPKKILSLLAIMLAASICGRSSAAAPIFQDIVNREGGIISPERLGSELSLAPPLDAASAELEEGSLGKPNSDEPEAFSDEIAADQEGLEQQLSQLKTRFSEIKKDEWNPDILRAKAEFQGETGNSGGVPLIPVAGLVQAEQFGEHLAKQAKANPGLRLVVQHNPPGQIPDRLQAVLRILRKRGVRFEYEPQSHEDSNHSAVADLTYPARAANDPADTPGQASRRQSIGAGIRSFFGITTDRIRGIRYSKPRPAAQKAIQQTVMLLRAGVISAFLAASAVSRNASGAALNPVLPAIVNVGMEFVFNWNPDANLAQRTQGRNYFFRAQPDGGATKGFEQNEPFFIGMSFLHSLVMRQALMLALNFHFAGPVWFTLTVMDLWTALATSIVSVFAKIRFESWLNRFRKQREEFQYQIAARSGVTRQQFKADPTSDRLYLLVSAGWMILQGLLAANNITGWSVLGQNIFYGLGLWGLWLARRDLSGFFAGKIRKMFGKDPALESQTRILYRAN